MRDSCLPDALPSSPEELGHFLARHRPPKLAALGLPGEFALPCYDLSIANVPATLARLLGAQLDGAAQPLPEALWAEHAPGVRRIVWLILDAVGWHPFSRLLAEEPAVRRTWLGDNGRLMPITSIVPTTTTCALITLWTGYGPAQHGLVGHNMFLRRFGLVADMLMLGLATSPARDQLLERGLDVGTFLAVPGLAQVLAQQGVTTRSLISVDLAKTGFSQLCFRGVTEVIPFVTAADMWVRMRELLFTHRDERLLMVGYLSEFDGIGHVEGPGSNAWRAVMRGLAFTLEHEFRQALAPAEREGTLLVVTADHGQLTEVAAPILLQDHPGLWAELLMPSTGSPRVAYLYTLQGRLEAARQYLRQNLADQFAVVGSEEALLAGLLGRGQPAPETVSRLGDCMLLARGSYLLDNQRRHLPAPGMHAGLNPQEMLVPLVLSRLD